MADGQSINITWLGTAHYQIETDGVRIVIDPFYSRLAGAKPQLKATRESIGMVDYLLLTHGHLDHAADFAFVAERCKPETFAPAACIRRLGRQRFLPWGGRPSTGLRTHALEQAKGQRFRLGDAISLRPFQIGTEALDPWFMRDMLARPFRHHNIAALADGLRWLLSDLFGNCFAFHFDFEASGKSLLFLGNLTSGVDELQAIDRVDVLALPYCPANKQWIADSQALIRRFTPAVVLVHHFDNFMPPFTDTAYMSLGEYRRTVADIFPDVRFVFSKFERTIAFAELLH